MVVMKNNFSLILEIRYLMMTPSSMIQTSHDSILRYGKPSYNSVQRKESQGPRVFVGRI